MYKQHFYKTMALSVVISAALVGCVTTSQKSTRVVDVFHGGLEQVDAANFDVAYLKSGADFNAYDSVLIDQPELAFVTPDRSHRQFPLTEEQKNKFRDVLADKFRGEAEAGSTLALVNEPGPSVLRLKIRVQDISATVLKEGIGNAVFTTQPIQHNAYFLFRTVLLTRLALDVTNDPF